MNKELFLAHIKGDYIRFLDRAIENLVFLSPTKAFAPGGHNGPHFAIESPVRNTCHWIVAFSIGHQLVPSRGYGETILSLLQWLIDDCPFFKNGAYVLRQNGKQDWCNGVIGHAWVIEALVRASRVLQQQKPIDFAQAIYEKHLFRSEIGAWQRFDPQNENFRIDFTLDHQVWFAAAAAELGQFSDVRTFLTACEQGALKTRKSGRINHLYFSSRNARAIAARSLFFLRSQLSPGSVDELEDGYQHYTLFPFARLVRQFPEHPFFVCTTFQSALAYLSDDWVENLTVNKYAFGYNAPGFELPLILIAFEGQTKITWTGLKNIYDQQLDMVCDSNRSLCSSNNPDPMTLTARIYELGLFIEACLGSP